MTKIKLPRCPFCGSKPVGFLDKNCEVFCNNHACIINGIKFHFSTWCNRPVEFEKDDKIELLEAKISDLKERIQETTKNDLTSEKLNKAIRDDGGNEFDPTEEKLYYCGYCGKRFKSEKMCCEKDFGWICESCLKHENSKRI